MNGPPASFGTFALGETLIMSSAALALALALALAATTMTCRAYRMLPKGVDSRQERPLECEKAETLYFIRVSKRDPGLFCFFVTNNRLTFAPQSMYGCVPARTVPLPTCLMPDFTKEYHLRTQCRPDAPEKCRQVGDRVRVCGGTNFF